MSFGGRRLPVVLSSFSRHLCQKPLFRGSSVSNLCRNERCFSELPSIRGLMERRIRDMDRIFDNFFHDIRPFYRSGFPKTAWNVFEDTRTVPVVECDEKDGVYRLQVNMEGFNPEDITVTLKNDVITIRGKKESTSDSSHFLKDFCYQYNLPENINPDGIRSLFTKGVLTIEAPLPAIEESKTKEIPIQKENSDKKDS